MFKKKEKKEKLVLYINFVEKEIKISNKNRCYIVNTIKTFFNRSILFNINI